LKTLFGINDCKQADEIRRILGVSCFQTFNAI